MEQSTLIFTKREELRSTCLQGKFRAGGKEMKVLDVFVSLHQVALWAPARSTKAGRRWDVHSPPPLR